MTENRPDTLNLPSLTVSAAIATRKSIRAFKSDPVKRETLEEILTLAIRAPSGGNLQPWRVYAILDGARDELVRRVAKERETHPMGGPGEYNIYPPKVSEPYRTRRFELGEAMYATMNIPREDKAARINFFVANWEFFGAPAGLIFTMDRQMQEGQWADLGMLMENIMLLARERGLHTCPQESWSSFHETVREYLQIPDNEMIFAGMAIGVADETHPVNSLVSARAPLSEIVTFKDKA